MLLLWMLQEDLLIPSWLYIHLTVVYLALPQGLRHKYQEFFADFIIISKALLFFIFVWWSLTTISSSPWPSPSWVGESIPFLCFLYILSSWIATNQEIFIVHHLSLIDLISFDSWSKLVRFFSSSPGGKLIHISSTPYSLFYG